jgi:outer membrane lipoprotein-sorting protein
MHWMAWLIAAMLAAVSAAPGNAPAVAPAPPPAQPAAAAQPAAGELPAEATVDQVLDALDQRGRNLKSFDAKVTLTEGDVALALESKRTGTVRYQKKPDASERIRVVFDKKLDANKVSDEKIEYLLDGPWLVDRDYTKRIEVRRQVLKPGEKTNLLKLGEGPFPLPIGQKKEDVKRLFDVKKLKLARDDPAGTVRLTLTPVKGTQFARKFKLIEVWVDVKTHMPRKIGTVDLKETMSRATDLTDVRLNADLADAEFKLDPVPPDKWRTHEEQFTE